MAKKMIRPLRSEADYDAALKEIEEYFENKPKPSTPEADRFDLLGVGVRLVRGADRRVRLGDAGLAARPDCAP